MAQDSAVLAAVRRTLLTEVCVFGSSAKRSSLFHCTADTGLQRRASRGELGREPSRTVWALAQVFRALAQVFRAPAQIFRAPAQVFRAPAQVFRAPAQVFRAPAQVFRAPAQVFRAPAQVFR